MVNSILVWYLVVSSSRYSGFATQLGPYSDYESCNRVWQNTSKHLLTTCVQVYIPETLLVKEYRGSQNGKN